jgi:hypothetical protein
LEGERLLGYGGLVHIAWEHRRAEVSFLLDTEIASDMEAYSAYFSVYIGLIKTLASKRFGFHKLYTETYRFREGVIHILEENGFRLEGHLLDYVCLDGKWVDSMIHGSMLPE